MSFDLVSLWGTMGLLARAVAILLGLMSMFVVGVSLERYRAFARGRKAADAFVDKLRQKLDGASLAEVKSLTGETSTAPIARVAHAAARAIGRTQQIDALDLVVGVKSAVERTIERETSTLKRGLGGLATVASIAPFVGLFGTVVGIINAFSSMAVSGQGGLASVSAGIAEALVTTAFGLLVAIPALAIYNHLTGMVDGFVVDMNEVASELVEAVLLRKNDE